MFDFHDLKAIGVGRGLTWERGSHYINARVVQILVKIVDSIYSHVETCPDVMRYAWFYTTQNACQSARWSILGNKKKQFALFDCNYNSWR